MSSRKMIAVLIFCQLAVLPGLAQGQSSDFDRVFAPSGAEARVSVTIPLGNSADKTKTAPRLGFAVRHYGHPSRPSASWMIADTEPYREVRLGLTLEDSAQFMINDEILLPSQGEQVNIGTVGKIGLGVAAVAVLAVGVVVLVCSNSDDSDCDVSAGG